MSIVDIPLITPDLKPELGDIAKDQEGRLFVWNGTLWVDSTGHVISHSPSLTVLKSRA